MKVLLSLVQNLDIFAWSPYEVPDVDLEFIVHKLNVNPPPPPPPLKEAKVETICQVSHGGREGGSGKAKASWGYKRSVLPRLVGQYCGSKEEEWEMEGLR